MRRLGPERLDQVAPDGRGDDRRGEQSRLDHRPCLAADRHRLDDEFFPSVGLGRDDLRLVDEDVHPLDLGQHLAVRGLDGAVRLPFARCLIEYEAVGEGIGRTSPLETERCSRRIVYAEQVGNEHLVLQTMLFLDSLNAWVHYPLAAM